MQIVHYNDPENIAICKAKSSDWHTEYISENILAHYIWQRLKIYRILYCKKFAKIYGRHIEHFIMFEMHSYWEMNAFWPKCRKQIRFQWLLLFIGIKSNTNTYICGFEWCYSRSMCIPLIRGSNRTFANYTKFQCRFPDLFGSLDACEKRWQVRLTLTKQQHTHTHTRNAHICLSRNGKISKRKKISV